MTSPEFGSRFPAFVMRDEEDESIDETLYDDNWIGYHYLIWAYKDALDEYEHFDTALRLVRDQLDGFAQENGVSNLNRLREIAPHIRGMDYKVLEPMVNELRDRGDDDLVEVTLEAFRTAPVATLQSKTKDRAAMKVAALQTLAMGSSGPEAEAAMNMASAVADKHAVTPKADPWDLIIDRSHKHRRVVHKEDVLIQKLDGALKRYRQLEQTFWNLRDHGRRQLALRLDKLEAQLMNPHPQRNGAPIVQKRR